MKRVSYLFICLLLAMTSCSTTSTESSSSSSSESFTSKSETSSRSSDISSSSISSYSDVSSESSSEEFSSSESFSEEFSSSESQSLPDIPKLNVPDVKYHALLDDGIYYLSWDEIAHATKYRVLMFFGGWWSESDIEIIKNDPNRGEYVETCRYDIDVSYTSSSTFLIVQAIGDQINYLNSDWSTPVEYRDAEEFKHTHRHDGGWMSTAATHYHFCQGCGEHLDEEEHRFSDWVPATYDQYHLIKTCSVCGYYEIKEDENCYNHVVNPYLLDPIEIINDADYAHCSTEDEKKELLLQARVSANTGFIKDKKGVVKSNLNVWYFPTGNEDYYVKNYKSKTYSFPEFKSSLKDSGPYLVNNEQQLHKKYQNEDNTIYRTVDDNLYLAYRAVDNDYEEIKGLMTEYLTISDPDDVLEINVAETIYKYGVTYRLKNPGEAKIKINWLNGEEVVDSLELTIRCFAKDTSIGEETITISEALNKKHPGPVTIRAYSIGNLLFDETGYIYVGWFAVTGGNGNFAFTSTESGYVEITGYLYDGYFYDSGVRTYLQPTNFRVIKRTYDNYYIKDNIDYAALVEKACDVLPDTLWLDTELFVTKAAHENVDIIPVEFIYWGDETDQKIHTSFNDDEYLPIGSVDIPRTVTGIDGTNLNGFVPGTYYLFKGLLIQNYENWSHINTPTFIGISSNIERDIVTETEMNTAPQAIEVEDVNIKQYEETYAKFEFDNDRAFKDRGVNFTSSNPDVFTVDYQGKITAKGIGEATLTVTTRGGVSGTSKVTVTANDKSINLENIYFASDLLEIDVGDVATPNLVVYPANATNREINYVSSDETILRIENGKMVGLKAGYVNLTATCGDLSATTRVLVNIKATNNGYDITPAGNDPLIHNLVTVDDVYNAVNEAISNHYSSLTFRYDYALNNDDSEEATILKNNLCFDYYLGKTPHEAGFITLFDYIIEGTLGFNNVKMNIVLDENPFDKEATSGHFDITLNIEYLSDSASIERDRISTHINSTNIVNLKTYINQTLRDKRDLDFDDFALFKDNKGTMDVSNSNELVYALSNGYLPHFTMENSEAERLYNKMLAVLRNIITTDMDDGMRIQSIYEYVSSLKTNQYTEYFRQGLLDSTVTKDLYGSEATLYSPDDHAYFTQYLESWDSIYGIGLNAMHKLLAALLGIEGFGTITNYAPITQGSEIDDEIVYWRYYVPLTQIEIDDEYYYFTPQNDKYIDCTSVYSQMIYRGFLLPVSQVGFCDALSSGFLDGVTVIGKNASRYVTVDLQKAVDDYSKTLEYGFDDAKQFGNAQYDYRINSEEELTALCNDIAATGYKGLGYVTIELGYQMGWNLLEAREHLFNAIDNSELTLNPVFYVSARKEIGDSENVYSNPEIVEEFRSHPGYILGGYNTTIVDEDFNGFDLSSRITITFDII